MSSSRTGLFKHAQEFIQRRFLWLLIGVYILAAILPGPGEVIRRFSLGSSVGGVSLSVPMMLLAFLLFNAGMGANVSEMATVLRRPRTLVVGVVANVLFPVGFLRVSSAKVGGSFVHFDVNWNIVYKNAIRPGGFPDDRHTDRRTGSASSTTSRQDERTG